MRTGFEDAATAGFVVTGGTAIMEGLPELAERVLGQPVRRGAPAIVGGLVETVSGPIYATGVGLALYGAKRPLAGAASSDIVEKSPLSRLGRRLTALFGEIL
jgi:cell division protein FtsA